jgi:hypothetical protein
LEALIEKMDGVRLRKIEIPRGPCAVAEANRIRGVPTLWLYDGARRVSSDTQDVLHRLAKKARG